MSRADDAARTQATDPPSDAQAALARAGAHGRRAAAEALAAVGALLDAAALAGSGKPAAAHPLLGPLAEMLAQLAGFLGSSEDSAAGPVVEAITRALDAEIERWERRAQNDADARAVLRAFLGLRELLWEAGIRRPPPKARTRPTKGTEGRERPSRAPARTTAQG